MALVGANLVFALWPWAITRIAPKDFVGRPEPS